MNAATTILRDRDIRGPLQQWLRTLHKADPSTRFIHELEIPRPSARVDLAMINGRLAGFEIKSDADRLERLLRQAASFSQVFERMTIVVTPRNLSRVEKPIPRWWEIVVCEGNTFHVCRRGRLNRNVDLTKLLYILTKVELIRICNLMNESSVKDCRKKGEIISELVKNGRKNLLKSSIREVLKNRGSI